MKAAIALAQMQIAHGDFRHNTGRAVDLIARAAASGSGIILFPEMWTAGFDYSDCRSYALANRNMLATLQKTADEKGISIGGSYLVEENGKFFNQFNLLQPGQPLESYNKIHLFHLMGEDAHLSAGSSVSVVTTRYGTVSLAVCYDLRFPEMFRAAREHGAALTVLSAGWPARRIDHWKILVRARAIENQCFFAAVNAVGGNDQDPFGGCSVVADPWGKVLAEAGGEQEELITVELDLDEPGRVRRQFPFFEDRLDRYSL